MTRKFSRTAAVLASAAAFSMMATPAMARDRGWGGGWGGGWGRHHDDIDAGDVLAGILIIGGIAAIASAASSGSKNKRSNPQYRDPPPPPPQDSRDYGNDTRPQWNEGSGINGAVNHCIDEVSRGKSSVDSVDSVNREGDGWRVQGRASGGSAFTCTVDGDGRIRQVSIDGHAI